jgi:hypothetical protein
MLFLDTIVTFYTHRRMGSEKRRYHTSRINERLISEPKLPDEILVVVVQSNLEPLPVIWVDLHGDLLNFLLLKAMDHGLIEKQSVLEFPRDLIEHKFYLLSFFVESTMWNEV